jgi:hypothetical protein
LFCGDALGGYFSDVRVAAPSSVPGSDPILAMQSIDKLRDFDPLIFIFASSCLGGDNVLAFKCAEFTIRTLMATKNYQYFSKTLEKGMIILDLFDRDHQHRGLSEIARLTGINKTSTENTRSHLNYS